MGKNLERAKELRNDPNVHYNCAQAVLASFAPDAGISEADACRITANFGSGMKMGGTCGAVTGGLMALGLYGVEEGSVIGGYLRAVRDNHGGCLECRELLRKNREAGLPQKAHCDGMVYECTGLAEEILKTKTGRE